MRKFYLIPERMYENFISEDNQQEEFSEKLLSDTINNKKLDASTKNVLFNQRLHGHLKHKKNVSNKPLRVIIDDQKIAAAKNDGENLIIADEDEITSLPHSETSLNRTQTSAAPTSSGKTLTSTTRSSQTQGSNDSLDRLKQVIMLDKEDFGVNEKGQILNNGVVKKNSNVNYTLNWLLKGQKGKKPSGTDDLMNRLRKNQHVNNMINSLQIKPLPRRVSKRTLNHPYIDKFSINSW